MTELIADSLAIMLGGADPKLTTKTVTENGTYRAADEPVQQGEDKYDGYSQFTANVSTYEDEYEAMLECFDDMADVIEEATGTRPADCEEAIEAVEGMIDEIDKYKAKEEIEDEFNTGEPDPDVEQATEEAEEEEQEEYDDETKAVIEEVANTPTYPQDPSAPTYPEDIFPEDTPDMNGKKFLHLVGDDQIACWCIEYGEFRGVYRDQTYKAFGSAGFPDIKVTEYIIRLHSPLTYTKTVKNTGAWKALNRYEPMPWSDWGTSYAEVSAMSYEEWSAFWASKRSWLETRSRPLGLITTTYETDSSTGKRRPRMSFFQDAPNGGSYTYDSWEGSYT